MAVCGTLEGLERALREGRADCQPAATLPGALGKDRLKQINKCVSSSNEKLWGKWRKKEKEEESVYL